MTEGVSQAGCILVGTVVEQASAWNAEPIRIYTRTTIEVDEYLKGDEGNRMVVPIVVSFLIQTSPGIQSVAPERVMKLV